MSSSIERIVVDTNVLVSAFLSPSGTPAQVLTFVLAGELRALFDSRILDVTSDTSELVGDECIREAWRS